MRFVGVLLPLVLFSFPGCATSRSLSDYRSGDWIIYSGVRYNSRTLSDEQCASFAEKSLAVVDYPGSFLLDTALLPLSISLQIVGVLAHPTTEPSLDTMSFYDRERFRRRCAED